MMTNRNRKARTSRPAFSVIVIAASAGGITALTEVLGALTPDVPAAVVILQHRTATGRDNHLPMVLGRATKLPVVLARDGEAIEPGIAYVARPDLHLTISPQQRFEYRDGARIRHVLSSANPLFESAAAVFGDRLIGVVLTGYGSDGTDGVQTIRAHGGIVIVQDPLLSHAYGMPLAAIRSGAANFVLPLEAIGPTLVDLVQNRPMGGAQPA